MNPLRASIVVPALNEGESIITFLERLEESVQLPVEVLVIVDTETDTTLSSLMKYSAKRLEIRGLVSEFPKGPANAIRYGIHSSKSDVVVITMADGSDDPRAIDDLIRLVERGCAVAAASRYMAGGQQIGGPRLKKILSRNASRALWLILGVGTHDSTNSFKAYSKGFISAVGIESDKGFEVGLELVAKAHRSRRMIAEVPTIWIDRAAGESNFQLKRWLPQYLRWFFYAFGPKSTR
jgi:glycosyltransferase involved in cell wall biosynthesis